MSDARDILLALDLPAPARQWLLAGDDRRLVAELGANYARYHAHLRTRLEGVPAMSQSLTAADGPALAGSLKAFTDALNTFQRHGRLLQDVGDAEQMLRQAAALVQRNATVAALEDIYRADAPLPLMGPAGQLLSKDEAATEAHRLDSLAAAPLQPSMSPMDALRRFQGK
jgi:hypothetical protein